MLIKAPAIYIQNLRLSRTQQVNQAPISKVQVAGCAALLSLHPKWKSYSRKPCQRLVQTDHVSKGADLGGRPATPVVVLWS